MKRTKERKKGVFSEDTKPLSVEFKRAFSTINQ
jgi:hypothetical protein